MVFQLQRLQNFDCRHLGNSKRKKVLDCIFVIRTLISTSISNFIKIGQLLHFAPTLRHQRTTRKLNRTIVFDLLIISRSPATHCMFQTLYICYGLGAILKTIVNSVLRNCAETKKSLASGPQSSLFLAVLNKCAKFHEDRSRHFLLTVGRKKKKKNNNNNNNNNNNRPNEYNKVFPLERERP